MNRRIDLPKSELERLWSQWLQDKSLRYLRFGQYVLNRYPVVWPECYYADTDKAYTLLLKEALAYELVKSEGYNTTSEGGGKSPV